MAFTDKIALLNKRVMHPSRSCPSLCGNSPASSLLWAGQTPGRDRSKGYAFPFDVWTRATCGPVRPAGSPRLPGSPLSTCHLQTPQAVERNAPVVSSRPWQASPLSWKVTTANRVTRPNRVHKCYGLYSIRPCLTIRVTPARRVGNFAVNRQLPRVASQPPESPELRLARCADWLSPSQSASPHTEPPAGTELIFQFSPAAFIPFIRECSRTVQPQGGNDVDLLVRYQRVVNAADAPFSNAPVMLSDSDRQPGRQ